ncbi:MAG: response regulator [Chloroflexi bacterium]|nr:response regulator [Chloroflexota bacterium]
MAQTRVVIADDDPIIRMDLREMLTGLGYSVVGEAADGSNAVSLARELRPDLVIMDIRMPELDGIEAARLLTGEEIAPVLLLTAYSEPDLVQRATQAGVIGYLVKPFRETQLGPAIEVTLGRFREFQQVRKELGDMKEALEARKVIDRAKGLLMDRYGLSEGDAFRRIQKRSMDMRKSMREVAEAILLASELEKEQ